MRRASVCGFLHEANVAVVFSFSSLSLCDIVYWEQKEHKYEQKTCSIILKEDTVIRFVIATCHDPHSSSFILLILTPEKLLPLILQCPLFSMMFAKRPR